MKNTTKNIKINYSSTIRSHANIKAGLHVKVNIVRVPLSSGEAGNHLREPSHRNHR